MGWPAMILDLAGGPRCVPRQPFGSCYPVRGCYPVRPIHVLHLENYRFPILFEVPYGFFLTYPSGALGGLPESNHRRRSVLRNGDTVEDFPSCP
jgi:hypothetical protein